MIYEYSGPDPQSEDGRWRVIVHARSEAECACALIRHMKEIGRNELLAIPDAISRRVISEMGNIYLSTVERDRENRAFDALIVSVLRMSGAEDDIDPSLLPELTEEEKAAVDSLGDDFVEKLLKENP